eukprot:TRINITY_DN34546_c0_g1_i1.p1 TRINITY_DN34546_c0_g1~~TRINITY_DN34546_c0_g1_i1.p1  ORF type:complete len:133 (-),score=29.17 TRINITY_DN34546_c0_g1_i1:42-440(-)
MSEEMIREAHDYLVEKHVLELFEDLTTKLSLSKTNDPVQFLIKEVNTMLAARSSPKSVSLFNEEDLIGVFTTFDKANVKSLNAAQLKNALMTVGVKDIPELPVSATQEEFVTIGMKCLDEKYAKIIKGTASS